MVSLYNFITFTLTLISLASLCSSTERCNPNDKTVLLKIKHHFNNAPLSDQVSLPKQAPPPLVTRFVSGAPVPKIISKLEEIAAASVSAVSAGAVGGSIGVLPSDTE